jgi:3-hydroxyisobutyrate dehydrogenase-like beta-hydroxyacid dehydrogenase
MLKDLRLVTEIARSLAVPLPATALATSLVIDAKSGAVRQVVRIR